MTRTVESQQTWTRHPAHCGRSGLFSSLLSAIFTWVLHKTLIIVRTPSARLKRSVNQHLLLKRARVDEKALSFMAHKLSFRASALSYWSEKDKHTPPFALIHNLSIHWSEENPFCHSISYMYIWDEFWSSAHSYTVFLQPTLKSFPAWTLWIKTSSKCMTCPG